ncbi:ethylene-responsive transcription factor 3-like [Cornus florida]|uniref:ethylene-responsive transcription factor 3-like n=1 Tax=Cornus florida TaxID=4283 RepID=UPI0028A0A38C|nr:ethylene-responsive transcription factor 3-like [Cornus florida]
MRRARVIAAMVAATVDTNGSGPAAAVKEIRFRNVRKITWGRFSAETRGPRKKTKVWLSTFDSTEDAARAYDAAALSFSPIPPYSLLQENPNNAFINHTEPSSPSLAQASVVT